MTNKLDPNELRCFTGSEQAHKLGVLFPNALLTDGALYVAQKGGAYWLMEVIASAQRITKVKSEPFQVWRLKVNEDKSALVIADDGNENIIYTQAVPFTDFSLPEFKLYASREGDQLIILLPGEY